jgi:hypothetical protein
MHSGAWIAAYSSRCRGFYPPALDEAPIVEEASLSGGEGALLQNNNARGVTDAGKEKSAC